MRTTRIGIVCVLAVFTVVLPAWAKKPLPWVEGSVTLAFLPDGRTVQARTWSPYRKAYRTRAKSQFTFRLAGPVFGAAGKAASVPAPAPVAVVGAR